MCIWWWIRDITTNFFLNLFGYVHEINMRSSLNSMDIICFLVELDESSELWKYDFYFLWIALYKLTSEVCLGHLLDLLCSFIYFMELQFV